MPRRDVITIDDLTNDDILEIFRLADELAEIHRRRTCVDLLRGKILAALFYEPSTRTRLSFETAMHRLGGDVVDAEYMQVTSSAAKGETIADTAKVVSQYADVIVIRHPWDGSAEVAARNSDVPVINAGDGSHEHPTQTLCDLYTLVKEKGDIRGLTVALCGDLKYGRTTHSLASALARFGAQLVLIPGPDLELPDYLLRKLALKYEQKLERAHLKIFTEPQGESLRRVFKNFDAIYIAPQDPRQRLLTFPEEMQFNIRLGPSREIRGVDVMYMTRYQKERLTRELSAYDYPKIDSSVLRSPSLKEAIVMHPLPRVDEITRDIDKDPRSKYFSQVSYGVVVRMALLRFLFESSTGSPGVATIRQTRRMALYQSSLENEITCPNGNCASNHERDLPRLFEILTREKTYVSHDLILECCYCAFEVSVSVVGNRRTKKFCKYDPALEETVEQWLSQGALALFMSERDGEQLGFEPYTSGPQRQLMNSGEVEGLIEQLAREISTRVPDLREVCLIGIRRRGDILAQRIATIFERDHSVKVPVGSLDVIPFRDDVRAPKEPSVAFDFSLDDKVVVLVDDVFYTGRTTRAAMKAVASGIERGRPKDVKVAVLVRRAHRELPLQPDFVGKHLPSSKMERVEVRLRDHPGRDEVIVFNVLMEGEQKNGATETGKEDSKRR